MRPKSIDIRRRIAADPATVWALISDSATWPSWTTIDSYVAERPGGPDRTGEIRTFRAGRYTVREEIVERRERERLSYVPLTGLAVRDYRADVDLMAAGADQTDLRWYTTFQPLVPGSGWLYHRALRRATHAFVDGLADRATRQTKR